MVVGLFAATARSSSTYWFTAIVLDVRGAILDMNGGMLWQIVVQKVRCWV